MPGLLISLFGSFQVTLGNKPVEVFTTDKVRALLAYLAVESERPHRRSYLAGLLWPDQEEKKALHGLRQALSTLRKALSEEHGELPFLLTSRESVQINPDSDFWLDVGAFRAQVQAALRHHQRHSKRGRVNVRRLEQAIDLYRGRFLDEFYLADSALFEEWATLQREALNQQALEALSLLLDYYEKRQKQTRARQIAARILELAPWEETIHRQLMRLLAQDGQWSAATAQYHACRRYLAAELGVEPTPETTALFEEIRRSAAQNVPLARRYPVAPHNLPTPATPFVGRTKELDDLADSLGDPQCRLLTLLGPGGMGKTRLALEAAREQVGLFSDGVFFIPLRASGTRESLAPAIADAIGFVLSDQEDPERQLLNYLRGKQALLILDNFEHLLDSVDLVMSIFDTAPSVLLLVTSRERLNLTGEYIYNLHGLSYPEMGNARRNWVESYGASALFLNRAQRLQRSFVLTQEDEDSILRICHLVEGSPLAIELAAAATWTHSFQKIETEIAHNLDFLNSRTLGIPERHRSLRATFDYSWETLSPNEQETFARLSVFHGGFQQEAALQVAEISNSLLAALLDKSLLRTLELGRYDMHGLLGRYASEKLEAEPISREKAKNLHTRYFVDFLCKNHPRLKGHERGNALADIALEFENIRHMWEYALTHDLAAEIDACADSLYFFCNYGGRFDEGINLFGLAVGHWEGDLTKDGLVASLLSYQGALYHRRGAYEQASECLESSLALTDGGDKSIQKAFIQTELARVAYKLGDYPRAKELLQTSLALYREHEDVWGIASALHLLGTINNREGQIDLAEELLEESLAFGRKSDGQYSLASPLNVLADIACHRGDYTQAQKLFEQCIALSRETGDFYKLAIHLNNLGTVLHILEDYEGAQAYYQESLDICRQIGDQQGEAIALSNLGEVAFALDLHTQARDYYLSGLSIGRATQDQWAIVNCLNNLGEVYYALSDDQAAKDYLFEALELAMRTQVLGVVMKVLVNLARLYQREERTRLAMELLMVVQDHAASEEAVRKMAEELLTNMQNDANIKPRSLDKIIKQLLAENPPPSRT